MANINKRGFLLNEFPALLKKLTPETVGSFGLMTPQHMVEHLSKVLSGLSNKYEGERETPANKRQLGMQRFIKSGAVLRHRPSDKTKADLPALKYSSLEEAITTIPSAAQTFYDFWDANPDYIPYASFMGEVSYEDLEMFHYMHVRYHLWQFGLIGQYP